MSFNFNNNVKVEIFGTSHSESVGVEIQGLPIGTSIDLSSVQAFVDRRKAKDSLATSRREEDKVEVVYGIENGKTISDKISLRIENNNVKSNDYNNLKTCPRPSHADYVANVKYNGKNDVRGGGFFSGRMTAPLCIAGGIAKDVLESKGIYVGSHVFSIKDVHDEKFDLVNVNKEELAKVLAKDFPVIDDDKGEQMKRVILSAKGQGDSVGGIIEGAVVGMPVGVGEPRYQGLENVIASSMFGIPAVKGIEFGNGFYASTLFGSENNDEFYYDESGNVKTRTNNSGGINGGISNGMPIIVRVAFKPTPSIAKEQNTVDLEKKENTKLIIKGRHDPCFVQRVLPAVESVLALSVLDLILGDKEKWN